MQREVEVVIPLALSPSKDEKPPAFCVPQLKLTAPLKVADSFSHYVLWWELRPLIFWGLQMV